MIKYPSDCKIFAIDFSTDVEIIKPPALLYILTMSLGNLSVKMVSQCIPADSSWSDFLLTCVFKI